MEEALKSGMEKMIKKLKLQPSICYTTELCTNDWMDAYMCIWVDAGWASSVIDDTVDSVVRAWSVVQPTSQQHQRYTKSNLLFPYHQGMDGEDELELYVSK